MSPLFACLWFIVALSVVFFIRRINLKNKASSFLFFAAWQFLPLLFLHCDQGKGCSLTFTPCEHDNRHCKLSGVSVPLVPTKNHISFMIVFLHS